MLLLAADRIRLAVLWWRWRGTGRGSGLRLGSLIGLRAAWLLHPTASVRAVRLRDITVIHSCHLPVWALPRNAVAMPAIFAARIARSSLLIRWRLK